MKSFKMMGFSPKKSKRGFTLIELLIVMVILAILAGVIVMAVSGVFRSTGQAAYTSVQSEVEAAITQYSANSSHPGAIPTLSGNITIGTSTNYSIIDFREMLISNGGLMKTMPTGLLKVGSGLDNCDGNDPCSTKNHYVWGVDSLGNVVSVCTNTTDNKGGCTSGSATGYQGKWP